MAVEQHPVRRLGLPVGIGQVLALLALVLDVVFWATGAFDVKLALVILLVCLAELFP